MSTPSIGLRTGRGRGRHSAPTAGQTIAILLCPVLPALVFTLPIPLAGSMTAAFGGTPEVGQLVSAIVAISALLTAVLAPLAGRLIDAYGRVRPLAGACVVVAVAGTAPIWLGSLELILASRVLLGAANAVVLTTFVTLIGDGYRLRERDRLFGLQVTVSTVVGVLMPVVVVALAGSDWRVPFALHLIGLPIALLLLLLVPERHRLTRFGARRLPPLEWRGLGTSCGMTALGSLLFYSPIVFLPGRLTEIGVGDRTQLGLYLAVAGIGTVAGASSFGLLPERRTEVLLPVAFVIGGVGVLGAGVGAGGGVALVVASAVVGSFGCGLLLPTLLAWAVGALNIEQRGRSTGWWIGCLTLGPVMLQLISAALAGPLGGVGAVRVVIGIVSLMLAALAPAVVRGSGAASTPGGAPAAGRAPAGAALPTGTRRNLGA